MSKKAVFSSKREANNVLWGNDSPYRQKIVKNKKRYKRKEKHTKKGLDGPFALSTIPRLSSSLFYYCPTLHTH